MIYTLKIRLAIKTTRSVMCYFETCVRARLSAYCTHTASRMAMSAGAKCPVNYETSENVANDIQKHFSVYIPLHRPHRIRNSWRERASERGRAKLPMMRSLIIIRCLKFPTTSWRETMEIWFNSRRHDFLLAGRRSVQTRNILLVWKSLETLFN